MPIHERNGALRVRVWVRGKPIERVVRGGMALARQVEAELRRQGVARKPKRVRVLKNDDGTYALKLGEDTPLPVVYFIKQGTIGPIKIGFTSDPSARFRALRSGSSQPLYMLGAVPGGRALESVFHLAFSAFRIEGTEWFRPAPTLLALVRELFQDGNGASA